MNHCGWEKPVELNLAKKRNEKEEFSLNLCMEKMEFVVLFRDSCSNVAPAIIAQIIFDLAR